MPAVTAVALVGKVHAMTKSDYDFVCQIMDEDFPHPPAPLRATALAGWYSILLGCAVLAGAVIGFAA